MDSLSFDDLIPQQDEAKPAQPEPSVSFDDLVPQTPPVNVSRRRFEERQKRDEEIGSTIGAIGEGISSLWNSWGELSPEEGEAQKRENLERARQQELWAQQQRADIESRMGRDFIPGQTLQESAATEARDIAEGPAPTKTAAKSAAEGFLRETGQGIVSLGTAPGIAIDFVDWAATGDTNESGYTKALRGYSTAIESALPGDPARRGELFDQLAAGGGSMTSMIVGGGALRAAGVPFKAAQYYAGISQGGVSGYEDAEAYSATVGQKYASFFLNAGLGVTEAIPISRAFDRLNDASGGKVQQILANSAANSIEEFIQELGQGIGQNVIANWAAGYDVDRSTTEGVLDQAAVGFILGGIMGGGITAVAPNRPEQVTERGSSEEQTAALKSTAATAPTTPPAIDPAAAQAVTGTPVQPVAPKREQLLEIARRRDQRAQAAVTPEVTAPPAPTPEAPAEQSQPVDSPNAAGTEPPTAVGVGSAAPPVSPAERDTPPAAPAAETPATPNEEITANVPAAPTEKVPPSRANFYADSPETIKLQHAALRDPKNDRKAVVYSADTPIKDLPDKPQGKFIVRRTFKIDGVSTIVDFNTAKTNYGEVQKAIRTGKLNELLDLGPYNQQEVAESAAAGAAPVAVTERTPDGTEVKSATGTEETAPEQMQVLEETKSEPENTIVVEDPRQVIEGRRIDPNSLSEEERQRLVAASEPKRRVLLDQSPDAQYARELQAEANEPIVERVKKAAKEIRKGEVYEEPKPKGKNWTKAEKKEREETNTRSNELLQRTTPSEAERDIEFGFMDENVVTKNKARAAIRERAKAMLMGAKTAGLRLPEKVSDNADASMNLSDGAVAAINARDFLAQLKNPDPNKTVDEIYQDFLTDDMLLRNGQRDAVLGKRRADNDTRTRADTETAAETTASEAATPEDLVAAKEEGDEVAVEALKREVKVDGPAYTVGRATKAPVVETKKKRTLLKRESVGGEESVGSLNDADVLQEVTLADAIAESNEAKGNAVNKSIVNRILARMARNAGDTPVKIVDQSTLDEMFPDRPANAVDGFYDPQKDHIVVSANFLKNGQFDAQLLAHEGLHAYLQRAVDSDPTLKKDIQEILDFARDSAPANLKKAYGFKDVQEFLAEAMSNADFQNLLMSIRLPDALASKYDAPSGSVWQAIVSAVRKHLGLGRKDVDALSYTMRLVERAEARRGGEQDLVRGMRQRGLLSEGRQRYSKGELDKARAALEEALAEDNFLGYSGSEAAMNSVVRNRDNKERLRKQGMSQKTEELMDKYYQVLEGMADRAKRRSEGEVFSDEILHKVSLGDALARIFDTTPGRPFLRDANRIVLERITGRIIETIPDVEVKVVPQKTFDALFPDLPRGSVRGFYDANFNHIIIQEGSFYKGKFDTRLIAHEGVHAYLYHAIEADTQLKRDIQEILDFAKDYAWGDQKDAYGFTDVQEFIAEALTNRDFQNILLATKLPSSITQKYGRPKDSLWDALVDVIRKHFGLARESTDALSYVMRLVDRAEQRRPEVSAGQSTEIVFSRSRQRNYADELKAAGVPDDVAAELDTFIKEELGKAIDPATLSDLIEDFKAEFGQDTSASNDPMPEEKAKEKAKRAKAETEKEAKRMMRDTTKSREELLDEAYLKALDEFRPGRVPKQNSKALLSLLMNNQLALIADNFFGRSTNPVRRIADLIEKRRTGKQRYVEELGAVAQKLYDLERAYRKKDPEAWENFVSLAHDATMAQVHPDKPLDDEIHKYLGSNKALGGKWSKKQHPRLAAVYNSLPGDLQVLYRETRDALTATRDRVELGNVSAVLRKMGFNDEALAKRFLDKKSTEADRKLVGDVVADYIENIVRLSAINGPYFNLARQGDIVLTGRYKVTTPSNAKKIEDGVFEFKSRDEAVKFAEEQMLRPTIARVAVDPKTGERFFVDDDGTQVKATFADPSAEERYRVTVQTKYVEFFHSEAAAREKAEALADAVELNDIEPKRFERSAANADMLSDQMRSLASTLDTRLKSANLTPEQKAILKGTLNEASLRFMASTRLQTHRLPRRYVQGASKDLVVSTYQYVDSSAGYLAKLDTQVELEDAMRQMEKATSALSARREGIGGGARAISNEVERRVNDIDYNMDQGLVAGTANRVMSVNFINHLMSPMYTVLQVVQTPLVAGPVLSAEYGAARTSYHLMKASKDIGALQIGLKGIGATAKGVAGVNTPGRAYTDYAKARLNPLERRALDELIKLGVVDADAGFDVTRLERKDNKVARGVDATLEYFSNIARAAPQSVEAINRAVVGLATFRMEAARGTNFKDAVRKAQEAVELSHFNMSASNAAPIFRNPVGRLLLQFKKYGQNIYFLHYYNAARLLRPKAKGDRAKGAKTLLYLAATHQIAAGLVGLPIEPLKIAVLVLGMIPGMPEWEDLEREAEEALAEMMGKSGAEAMMYGLPRLADIDISSRVGLSSLLLFGEPGEMGDKDSVQSWFLNMLLGPTVGSATDIAGGVAAVAEGDAMKAAEKLLPVKVISDTLRAIREVDEGKFDTQDALMRAFGVQSARQARIQQSTSADIDKRSELRREKNAIIKAWISADTASEKAKVVARMREYNKEAGKRDQLSKKFLENIRKKEMKKYEVE